ncbi:L-sorbose 1-dehydrogenase [Lachnellula arida]|uniref:L-sorbose 1-dehydrogenase n=1 Tax=Lachnellula arida TaxID=1316785 RepID=A0A8T9BBA7_9HELO|nr:L-sorbose 1-dehydrogenase [Lachnellula arida]
MSTTEADYIIVGGGLTGCTLAARLHQGNPSLIIIIIEAGPDASDNPNASSPLGSFALTGSDLDWAYPSLPDASTNNRVHINNAGKALGGGSTINYAGWSRGNAADYDAWGAVVDDSRWSYAGLLPFFKKSETYFDKKANPEQHGFEGPIHIISTSASDPDRQYGLREPLLKAWTDIGVKFNPDPVGSTEGISEYLENWRDGQRQPAQKAYGIEGITVIVNTRVNRVVFSKDKEEKPEASGVQLSDGRLIKARKEVILSAGTFGTPHILLLSGIGSASALSALGIPVVHDAPEVGQNLFDHFAHFQMWKVRHPEESLAMGNPSWNKPAYFKGMPCDWVVNETVPSNLLEGVEASTQDSDSSLLKAGRCHIESQVIYAPAGIPGVPMNGTFIASSIMLLLPTSRGAVTLASASPSDLPLITSNYYSTKADVACLIYGTRRMLQVMLETSPGKEYIEGEITPPGQAELSPGSVDEEIEKRIRATGISHKHAAGTAAMGKVVGSDLKVVGVGGLRVVDGSVLPVPIGGHPQATLYALAEQAAEIILNEA